MIQFKTTEDGSATLYNSEIDECYHSIHGARAESEHIFVNSCLRVSPLTEITVLEIGFGTGLNALLTAVYAKETKHKIIFHTIELYPLQKNIINTIVETVREEEKDLFLKIHSCKWEKEVAINEYFTIHKHEANLLSFKFEGIKSNIVFFDAFSPEKQSELWSEEIFQKIFHSMENGAILTTYCSKGIVRRAMQSVGFKVEKLEGPAHKRHITRAIKQ